MTAILTSRTLAGSSKRARHETTGELIAAYRGSALLGEANPKLAIVLEIRDGEREWSLRVVGKEAVAMLQKAVASLPPPPTTPEGE